MSHAAIRITDISLTVFRWTGLGSVIYTRQSTPPGGESLIGLVTIHTDAGIEGHAFLGSSFRPVGIDARDGLVAVQGWAETAEITAPELAAIHENQNLILFSHSVAH